MKGTRFNLIRAPAPPVFLSLYHDTEASRQRPRHVMQTFLQYMRWEKLFSWRDFPFDFISSVDYDIIQPIVFAESQIACIFRDQFFFG
jgi:hypothetical protein